MAYLDPAAGARREGSSGSIGYITTDDLAPGAVATSDIADGAVTAGKLGTAAVTKAKSLTFFSTEQTGTGSPQNVAHGLAAAPAGVIVAVTEHAGDAVDVAEGTHTTTNVVVTVTTGVKFKVFAWA